MDNNKKEILKEISNNLEIVENVNEKIKKGETELKIFEPIESGVSNILEILNEDTTFKKFKELTEEEEKESFIKNLEEEEVKRLNKIATSLNKYHKEVDERRKDITREIRKKADNFKWLIDKKIEPLQEERSFLLEIKKLKAEEKEKAEILELLPTWKEKLSNIGIKKTDEELKKYKINEFYDFLEQETENFLAEIKRKEEEKKRIEEARDQAKKEAEEKAEKEKAEILRKAEEEKKEAVEKAKNETKEENKKIEIKKEDTPLVIFLKENGITKEQLLSKEYILPKDEENFLLYKLVAKKIK